MTGCSNSAPPQHPAVTSSEKQQSQSETPSDVDRLNAGESISVETSQGKINVEPTVVAITDAQAGNDTNQLAGEVFYNDPWESFNRTIFGFNHQLYQYVLIPAADGYRWLVPAAARDKIGNAFENIREPLNLLNNALAGEFRQAGANLSRFFINSTLGLFGLFDPATHWFNIGAQKQTIADTLFYYDIDSGPYLVLPFLGPSDSRGAFSTVTEGIIHPINQLTDSPESYFLRAFDGFDDFSGQAETYQNLYKQADDPYLYFRNQYIQGQRRDEYFQYQGQQDEE
ncbi:MlaA family lipoprotein [Salinimonas marina]|uniref:MlaA family lipoprotein n=1 Tax=Salinimonas marina TaxID=2785918 RepID=UPI001C550457|nr:VacJ family lipoprotein [Salinimonas marina]